MTDLDRAVRFSERQRAKRERQQRDHERRLADYKQRTAQRRDKRRQLDLVMLGVAKGWVSR